MNKKSLLNKISYHAVYPVPILWKGYQGGIPILILRKSPNPEKFEIQMLKNNQQEFLQRYFQQVEQYGNQHDRNWVEFIKLNS